MGVAISEVYFMLSAPNAVSGYSMTGAPGASFGNFMSTTAVSTTALINNLFPDITGGENAAQQVDYQCVFVYNSNTQYTMQNVMAWLPISGAIPGGAAFAIAADPVMPSSNVSPAPQAVLIPNAVTAPAGVTGWTGPVANGTLGVSLGVITSLACKALWVQRTATNSPPLGGDGFQLQVNYDTTP